MPPSQTPDNQSLHTEMKPPEKTRKVLTNIRLLYYITVLWCRAAVTHVKRPSFRATECISVPLYYLKMCDKGEGFEAFAWPVYKHEQCNRLERFFACAGMMGTEGRKQKTKPPE